MNETLILAVKDKLVVEPLKQKDTTAGGIVIPESATPNEPQLRARVISVGNEVTDEIKAGDTIMCHQGAGMDIMIDRIIYKVLGDGEVYATLRKETK